MVALAAVVIAGLALIINAREHRVFMRQLGAHARFRIEFNVISPFVGADGVVRVIAPDVLTIIKVRLVNEGEASAPATLLNVIGPGYLRMFRFSDSEGHELANMPIAHPSDVTLSMPDGTVVPASTLAAEAGWIGRLGGGSVAFVRFLVDLPEDGTTVTLPFRVDAQSDAMSPDKPNVVEDFVVEARRPTLPA